MFDENKNINWINAVKGLCVLCIFIVHCENFYGESFSIFNAIVLPFYVNAFFFISGYLLFWKQLSTPKIDENMSKYLVGGGKLLIANVLHRIIIPSIIFSFIEYIPKKIIKGDGIDITSLLYETVGGCTYWFTSALVIAELLFFVVFLTRKKNIWIYLIVGILMTFIGDYLATNNINIVKNSSAFPWLYKQGLICMTYLAAGGVYWKYEHIFSKFISKQILALMVIIFLILAICCRQYLSEGYLISLCKTHTLGVIFGIFASITIIEICKLLPEIRWVTFIGQNSIGFYFLSGALPITLSIISHKLFPETSIFILIMICIVCIVSAYAIVYALVRWIPWIFDLRKLIK